MGSKRYSPKFKKRALRLFREQRPGHASDSAAISSVAKLVGCSDEALRTWVRQAERDAGEREGLTTSEREELNALRREVRELKRANEIIRLASAYFARAELDRLQD